MRAKWFRKWWRADREELERQRAECARLRDRVAVLERRVVVMATLVRALRDVNADLDGRLCHGEASL